MARHASGTGPGAITDDGCSVELYALLPARGEPELVRAAVPEGGSILELGCGVGRMTAPLVRAGHRVVAVDNSADMLARVEGAETVLADIERLDLDRVFDAVLLASHLVNVPDAELRDGLLRNCRRHVGADGVVVIQRHAPAWFDTVAPGEATRDGLTTRLRDVSRPAPGRVAATIEHEHDGAVWTQTFEAERLDDAALVAALAAAGLELDTHLTEDGAWVRARPR